MPRTTPLDKIRNVGIMAHIDAGKTTTTERILYYTGRTYKLGEVHEGTATMDWMEQEQERGITITSAATTAFWTRLNQQYRINIIDTPGHVDFTVEVERSLRVLDGAVTVLDAVGGVEPQTETVWRQADRYGVPRIIFVNKMDRVGADFDMCLKMVRDRLGTKAVPIQLPLGSGELFTGLIDLVREIEIVYDDDTLGKKYVEGPVPEPLKERVAQLRHEMIEACVESDDVILHKYLEDHKLTEEEIRTVIRKATITGHVVPVICGAAFKNKGVQALLDAVVDYLPSPVDIPPIKGHLPHHDATHAERPASDDAPFAALAKLSEEDPTLRLHTDAETAQTIISGMGELHLEIIVERMRREFKVDANVGRPQVAYRETVRKRVEYIEGKFIRQSGGRGQYGHVVIHLEPGQAGTGFVFEDNIVGGSIPKEYIGPVEQGVKEALENGVLAGYPMVDVKVELVDGSFHDVDSSEMAFKIAGSMAVKEAARQAHPILLEPIMDVEVVTPYDYMGDVIGDLSARRGKIGGMTQRADAHIVAARVPLSEMFGYSTTLRSMSQGRAVYSMQFSHYQEVPKTKAEEIVSKVKG